MRHVNWDAYREVPIPEAYTGKLVVRPTRWSSVCASLYLMAVSGWNIVQELGESLADLKGIAKDSDSLRVTRRIFAEYLPANRLVTYETMPYFKQSVLGIVRLTDFGKSVCSACGWEPVESDWERLIRLHEGERQIDHTAAVLAFAREARLRDCQVEVVPELSNKDVNARPDLHVIDCKRRKVYVEVETIFHREKPEKWRNLCALQGFVAVASKTVIQRRKLVEEIKRLRLPGWATDLESLRANAKTGDLKFLFIERWDKYGKEIELPRNGGEA